MKSRLKNPCVSVVEKHAGCGLGYLPTAFWKELRTNKPSSTASGAGSGPGEGVADDPLDLQRVHVGGSVVVAVQTDARMVPASDRLYRAVVERRLVLPDRPEMRAHAANTIAKHRHRGWRLDKPDLRVPNDSIIALAMALDAVENQPAAVEILGWI